MKSFFGTITVFIVLGLIIYPISYYSTSEVITITVNEKERITTGSGETLSSKFIVFIENEVFENTDAISFGKFNSADIQGKLNVNETYTVKVVGWRVPFLSMYRKIIDIN